MRLVYLVLGLCILGGVAGPAAPAVAAEAELATGTRLAALLSAGRSVLSNHQDLINDPAVGEKNLDGQRLVDETFEFYRQAEGSDPLTDDLSAQDRRLVQAQIDSMREIIDEYQGLIDTPGVGFKGFIPAVFGRLVNERFGEKVGTEAQMKVTAPTELVRNRKALPDEWEKRVFDTKFRRPDWPKGQAFHERVDSDGRPAFRLLIPEYYSASCMSCHGKPEGELDVTGYPKEGRSEGDLSGAVSITLFK